MKLRYNLRELFFLAVAAACLAILFIQSQRTLEQTRRLERQQANLFDTLHLAARGNAVFDLLANTSETADSSTATTTRLRRELIIAVLEHWQHRSKLDDAMQIPNYTSWFVGRSAMLLGCEDGDAFVQLAVQELHPIYPDENIDYFTGPNGERCESDASQFITESIARLNSEAIQ